MKLDSGPWRHTRSVAEHAIVLAMALAKVLRAADRAVRKGDFDFKYHATLTELDGLTFGVISFGDIGQATARLARALGMQPLAYGPSRPEREIATVGVERAESTPALLARPDIVSLHLSLTPATRGLIGTAELAAMKHGLPRQYRTRRRHR